MTSIVKRVSKVLLTLTFLAATVTGCSTIEGMGKDVEDAGEEIQDSAN